MLRNYLGEHQDDWELYVGPHTYAYNSHVHCTTRTTPLELVLSRPPPEFSLRRANSDAPRRIGGTTAPSSLRPCTRLSKRTMGACVGSWLATSAISISACDVLTRDSVPDSTLTSTPPMEARRRTTSPRPRSDHTASSRTTAEP